MEPPSKNHEYGTHFKPELVKNDLSIIRLNTYAVVTGGAVCTQNI